MWSSDPNNVLKNLPAVGLPGDYFYGPASVQGEWNPYTETICSVDPSGRGSDETAAVYLSQRNGFIYVHEVRAYREGYSDNTLLDILRGCKKFGVTNLLIETSTLAMVSSVNCSKSICNRQNSVLMLRK